MTPVLCRRGHLSVPRRTWRGRRECRTCYRLYVQARTQRETERYRARFEVEHKGHRTYANSIGRFRCADCMGYKPPEKDDVSVERAISRYGHEVPWLNSAEKSEAVRILTRKGWSASEIADRINCSERTVNRKRAQHRKESR